MDKLEIKEKVWGGVFGVASILAAIAEMIANGFSNASVFGMVKDVTGTLVVVVILITFFSVNKKPKNITEILETAVETWGEANAPLIFKAEEYKADPLYSQGFVLLQKPTSYVELAGKNLKKGSAEWHKFALYGKYNKLTGKFIDMPSYDEMTKDDFFVLFTMNQSHFDNIPGIDKIIGDIVSAAHHHSVGKITAEGEGKQKIKLSCKKIALKSDVVTFVDELDFILSLVKVIV